MEQDKVNGVKITGRHAFGSAEFVTMFTKYVKECEDYIEIGTLFGGSACLAGVHCSGDVYCIDPLNGYYGRGMKDKGTGLIPSPEIVETNWLAVVGDDLERLHLYNCPTPPFPEDLKEKRFDVGYIDGDHSYPGANADWQALKGITNKYIIFDNIEKQSVRNVYDRAMESPDWEQAEIIDRPTFKVKAGVLRRVK